MAKFIFKKRIGKRSRKDNKSFISYPTIKKPVYSIVFQNENTGNFFEIEDTAIMKYKRDKIIIQFFNKYSNQKMYQLFEFGLPFITSENVGIIIQKIKRRCNSINVNLLGYIWVYDVGKENFGEHYHIVVSTLKLNDYKYPDALKLDYKGKKIHGDFVRKNNAFKNYLIGKCLYEKGYKKRLYGKSKFYRNVSTNKALIEV
tara:strand:- start:1172 stop:1774 length:603 start_codon:yes stop_codon:yes gene_type:complete